jgi:hypothetical protein
MGQRERALPRGAGEKLVCPLMKRLAALRTPTLVVAQYDPRIWEPPTAAYRRDEQRLSLLVLECAAEVGLPTLDLFRLLETTIRTQGHDAVFNKEAAHLNSRGSRLVAEAILEALVARKMIAPPTRRKK